MKYYFLALATLVTVCVGCQSAGVGTASLNGSALLSSSDETVARGNMGNYSSYRNGGNCNYFAPPAAMMAAPGPGVAGPGPGVLGPIGMASANAFNGRSTQVKFVEPEGMTVGWQIPGGYAENQFNTPNRYSFHQGAAYRLKLTNFINREGLVLYPTLQVFPAHPQTNEFLAHSCVPFQITDEDLDQIQANNFVTKVVYLPDPQHQELAIAGVETLVSTRLDPGLDPVAEADRRGTILIVIRIGNMDLESPEVNAMISPDGTIQHASHIRQVDGEKNEHVAPMPIAGIGANGNSIPPAQMMGVAAGFGQPPMNPVTGGPAPMWGMPITGTPIGLPGPTHLPYGGKAGLKSHTVRNRSKQHIPEPVDHFLIDVKQKPGINIPDPVKRVEYEENHPIFRQW
jgi:hypothetical protein